MPVGVPVWCMGKKSQCHYVAKMRRWHTLIIAIFEAI